MCGDFTVRKNLDYYVVFGSDVYTENLVVCSTKVFLMLGPNRLMVGIGILDSLVGSCVKQGHDLDGFGVFVRK